LSSFAVFLVLAGVKNPEHIHLKAQILRIGFACNDIEHRFSISRLGLHKSKPCGCQPQLESSLTTELFPSIEIAATLCASSSVKPSLRAESRGNDYTWHRAPSPSQLVPENFLHRFIAKMARQPQRDLAPSFRPRMIER